MDVYSSEEEGRRLHSLSPEYPISSGKHGKRRCLKASGRAHAAGPSTPQGTLHMEVRSDGATVMSARLSGHELDPITTKERSPGAVPLQAARANIAGTDGRHPAMGVGRGASSSLQDSPGARPILGRMVEGVHAHIASSSREAITPPQEGRGQQRPAVSPGGRPMPINGDSGSSSGDPDQDEWMRETSPMPTESLQYIVEAMKAMTTQDLEEIALQIAQILSAREFRRHKGGKGQKGRSSGKGKPGKSGRHPGQAA